MFIRMVNKGLHNAVDTTKRKGSNMKRKTLLTVAFCLMMIAIVGGAASGVAGTLSSLPGYEDALAAANGTPSGTTPSGTLGSLPGYQEALNNSRVIPGTSPSGSLASMPGHQEALNQYTGMPGAVTDYDVAASDTHGTGKLQINVDKHTFVFNGQGFTPSAMIELRARAAGSDEYVVFATGKVTPSGNLYIAGTWEADAAPEVVGTYYAPLTGFKLENTGWFVAKLACYYSTDGGVTWTETDHSSGIAKGGSDRVDWLIDLGVPDGALVKIHAIVVGGKDRTGDVWEYCDHMGDPSWGYHVTTELAVYEISGVTWNPQLEWISMTG